MSSGIAHRNAKISLIKLNQLSLLPSAGREMRSTGQSAVMLCGRGVNGGMAHSVCGCTCMGRSAMFIC